MNSSAASPPGGPDTAEQFFEEVPGLSVYPERFSRDYKGRPPPGTQWAALLSPCLLLTNEKTSAQRRGPFSCRVGRSWRS